MPSSSIPRQQQRQSRLLSLSIYCAATLLLGASSADAFSLVQNANPPSQQSSREPDGGGGGGASAASSANATRRGRSSAASASSSASSAAATAANPFRGSLNNRRGDLASASLEGGSDDFALRMGMQSDLEHDVMDGGEASTTNDDDSSEVSSSSSSPSAASCQSSSDSELASTAASISIEDETQQVYERRKFLHGMLATTAAGFTSSAATTSSNPTANAYEASYPIELQSTPIDEVETSSNSLSKLKEERLSNKRSKVAATRSELANDPLGLSLQSSPTEFILTVAGASTWALALWFATGSRSNPVVTPLANVLYDDESEAWLADRNDGYFADLPLAFTAILSAVFVFFGVILDRAVYFLSDGDAEVSLQLAGVSVIGGAVWEVGRLAAKEKAPTRDEYEREALLYTEFDEFAKKRIVVGRGSCHRSDVIGAFRRYNPKYRVADSERYPLADIEVERILREWNRRFGSGSEMSSAGFFSGIYVDGQADAFAPR